MRKTKISDVKFKADQILKDRIADQMKKDGRSRPKEIIVLLEEALDARELAEKKLKRTIKTLREPVPDIDELLGTTEKH